MDTLDEYLEELASRLDCDPLRRDEIRLEVHCHLRELIRRKLQEGVTPTAAVQDALSELGDPEEVARALSPRPLAAVASALARWGAAAIAFLVAWGAYVQADPLVRSLLITITPALGVRYDPQMPAVVAVVALGQLVAGALPAYVLWTLRRRVADVWTVFVGWGVLWLVQALEGWPYRGERLSELLLQLGAALAGTLITAVLLSRRDHAPRIPRAGAGAAGDAIDLYVSDVATRLPVDPLRRDEVRLEVHAHLRQLCADAPGATTDQAQTQAIARFGPVADVAAALAEANSHCPPTPLPTARLTTRAGAVAVAWLAYLASTWGVLRILSAVVCLVTGNARPEPPSFEAALTWALTHLLGGGMAALLVGAISRKPWDVLLVCAITAPLIVILRDGTGWSLQNVTDIAALCLGAGLVALALSRRDLAT